MSKKVCLIGLGLITKRYVSGFSESKNLSLCAVADINTDAVGRDYYPDYPFYTDYVQMIKEQSPDYVIISTPPERHFEIAAFCLKNNINIIIEKPVTLCIEDFDTLYNMAKERNLVFKTLFHWHGGRETIAFGNIYNTNQIEKIRVSVQDPYCKDGKTINSRQIPLMGAWIDSGVNILSMIRLWLPFKKLEIISTDTQRCPQTNLPVYVSVRILIDGIETEITVDWRNNTDQKESYVTIQNKEIYINHSGQSITNTTITEYERMPRLDEHYNCLFQNFDYKSNADFSRSVHEFLFKVNEML